MRLNRILRMSVAEENRKQLEALGDYVTRANVNWFAVFPDKLSALEQVAAQNKRESNLIVYRTRSDNNRDHHAVPFSELSELLTEECLTHSEANGTVRWNVTINDHILRVSHNNHSVDASRYFELPLAVETPPIDQELGLVSDLQPPTTSRVESTVYRILRDTELAKHLKSIHEYRCQMCGLSIQLPNDRAYAEAHHIQPLGRPHNGYDIAENIIIVCPNHHAMLDYGAMKLEIEEIRQADGHDIGLEFIQYHNETVCPE